MRKPLFNSVARILRTFQLLSVLDCANEIDKMKRNEKAIAQFHIMILHISQWLDVLDCSRENCKMKLYGNKKAMSQIHSHDFTYIPMAWCAGLRS